MSEKQAQNIRAIVFRFMTSMNLCLIEEFETDLLAVDQDTTSITYGTATIKAGTISVNVSRGFDKLR